MGGIEGLPRHWIGGMLMVARYWEEETKLLEGHGLHAPDKEEQLFSPMCWRFIIFTTPRHGAIFLYYSSRAQRAPWNLPTNWLPMLIYAIDLTSLWLIFLQNQWFISPTGHWVGEPVAIQQVSPGLHVLSNVKLDSPWPKTQRLGKSFKQILNKYGKNEVAVKEMVDKLMKDKVKADKSKLPGICALDWEFNHSSIFVEMDTPRGLCGTSSSAALTIRADGEVSFHDKYLDEGVWFEKTIDCHIHKQVDLAAHVF